SPDLFSSTLLIPPPHKATLFPYTTLFRSLETLSMDENITEAILRMRKQFKTQDDKRDAGLPKEIPEVTRINDLAYGPDPKWNLRSEEHTSELQSRFDLVCRLLLARKNKSN